MGGFGSPQDAQLGFGDLLAEAEARNARPVFARETAHLPGTMEDGLPFYRRLIERHHAAMLAGQADDVGAVRETARLLARKLNDGDPGILADENAPGRMLARESAAAPGAVPLWGQTGAFVLEHHGTRVRIVLQGMLGIAACNPWLGFAAHAVDADAPFISTTGYRSFLGVGMALVPDITPDAFAARIIGAHVRDALKGRLVPIEPRYRAGIEGDRSDD